MKANTVIGKIGAANAVPPMLAPTPEQEKEPEKEKEGDTSPEKRKLTQNEVDLLMSKLDLTVIKDWSLDEQREVNDLIIEYGSLFALKDLGLGKTDKVKHSIKLIDYTPFKERYRCIPSHHYEEVKQHLKEMLEIGAISKSKSPWASTMVLVRKMVP